MRIRSTKPEFWRSARVASVSWDARLVLKGLESYVDDNGVGKDDVALIVGDVFPRDMLASPRETAARVSEAISDLHRAGLLWRYEADSTPLLFIAFWEDVQRIDKPGKGRLPRPDGTFDYGASRIRESVASPRESLAPGTGEQGNRGTGAGTASLTADAASARPSDPTPLTPRRFDEFWSAYPRKVGKDRARTAYWSACRRTDEQAVIDGAYRLAADPNLPEAQFIPHPTTWLNRGGWDDEPLPARVDPRTQGERPRPGASVWDRPVGGHQ